MILATLPGAVVPTAFGVPVDFILFGAILAGVAVFHHHTFRVAVTGLAIIVVYKLIFTGFNTGPGFGGLVGHLERGWVILTNLFLLLLGFGLLSPPFQKTPIPPFLPP